jgi:UDP-N-acetylmuramoylalanine--D-glutamate ligase
MTSATLAAIARRGEVAVLGLGASGVAAARLLTSVGARVYVSDAGRGDRVREAAEALRTEGIEAEWGTHDLARIARAGTVVVSPGVPPTAPPLVTAQARGIPVHSEVDVALQALSGLTYLATTGTNGKTTVTALIGHLLRAVGHPDAIEAGNIGTPLAEIARRAEPPTWASLELSSFQLHDTPSVAPRVAVLTNLSPDHLDRYDSLDAYYGDKMRLFANATADACRVVNGDDAEVLRRTAGFAGRALRFSLADATAAAWFDRAGDRLMLAGAPLLPRAELTLLGDHNVANALCAALAVWAADPAHQTPVARTRLAEGLRTFRAIPHRVEPVGEVNGVLWVNDSKATNVSAARVALEGMTRPVILLLGGRHKGEPYTGLLDGIRAHGKAVLAYGEAAAQVVADLRPHLPPHLPVEQLGSSFEDVIARARALAAPGDVVLLAPACSSYDMFTDYLHRGETFRRLALGA